MGRGRHTIFDKLLEGRGGGKTSKTVCIFDKKIKLIKQVRLSKVTLKFEVVKDGLTFLILTCGTSISTNIVKISNNVGKLDTWLGLAKN